MHQGNIAQNATETRMFVRPVLIYIYESIPETSNGYYFCGLVVEPEF